jgi:DNA-binding NtrC family response regulator
VNNKVLIVEDQFVAANDLELMLTKAGYEVCGIAQSVPIAQEMIKNEKPGVVLLDIFLKGKLTGIDLGRELKEENIAFVYISANSNEEILSAAKTTEPYGFIVKPFREKDLIITLEIARYRHEHSQESRYRRQIHVEQQLEKTMQKTMNWSERLLETAEIIQQEIPFDYLSIDFNDREETDGASMSFLRIGFNEYQVIGTKELSMISSVPIAELNKIISVPDKQTSAAFFSNEYFIKILQTSPLKKLIHQTFQMRCLLTYPVHVENGEKGCLNFYSRRPDIYTTEHISLLDRLQNLGKIFKRKPNVVSKPINPFPTLNAENHNSAFEGIVGSSHLLLNVFDHITNVAPFDTAVLILGESGTGKEKIAECIHNLSPRKHKPLVKVNCAALPATLIESELFGHEKGSFTGATEKKIGKFELSNEGTIFLDEIGEMPVDLQVKLLRVLQAKEIEPIGRKWPVKIDVRVIAATNRNLEKEVGEGRFRLDLYYRLNVFPITLPPLRDRLEDIPALSQHFINTYNRKSGKSIVGLSDMVLEQMMAYNWPGNVRELENLIERSVLLSKGPTIEDISLPDTHTKNVHLNKSDSFLNKIHNIERDYILDVLRKCNGKIWGADGAAAILKIRPTTLISKIKKLGIQKDVLE